MTPPYNCITNILANEDVDTWLPTDSRIVPDMPSYFGNNAVYNVKDYGAVGNGSDATTAIQNAIDAATDGGIVLLPKGTYLISSDIEINNSKISLLGEGQSSKIEYASNVRMFVKAGDFSCKRLWLHGPGFSTLALNSNGLWIEGDIVNETFIENISIEDCQISSFGMRGLFLNFTKNVIVQGCTIQDIWYAAIGVSSGEDVLVEQNIIKNVIGTPNAYGIGFSQSGSSTVISKRCIASGNTIIGVPYWEGLDTHAGEDISFIGNTLKECMTGIAIVGDTISGNSIASKRVVVSNNIINESDTLTGGQGPGIVIAGITSGVGSVDAWAEDITCSGNVIRGHGRDSSNTYGALRVHSVKNVNILNNILRNPVGTGIMLQQDIDGVIVKQNIISDAWSNVQQDPSAITLRSGGTWNALIEDNSFTNDGANLGVYNRVWGIKAVAGSTMYGARVGYNINQYNSYFTGNNRVNQGVDTQQDLLYPRNLRALYSNSVPTNPTYGYQRGDIVWNSVASLNRALGYVCTASGAPATWAPIASVVGLSTDRGDANITLTMDDAPVQIFSTNLTVNRTITLPTNAVYNGAKISIVRTGLGAFTLAIGSVATIPASTAASVVVGYDGSAWRLVSYDVLSTGMTGTHTTLGFYGKSPVAQAAAISDPTGGSTIDTESRAAIGSILTVLRDLGLVTV